MLNKRKTPKVAIVLATYNGGAFLKEQLDSVYNQSDVEFNLYCSDDSSTDSTIDILKDYKFKKNNFFYEENSGKSGPANNFLNALNLVNDEDYVIFCDQDDSWLPHKISSLLNYADENIRFDVPGLAYCDAFVANKELDECSIRMYGENHTYPKTIEELLYLNGGVQGASMIINKAMITEMLNYSGYIYMHDQLATFLAVINNNISYYNKPFMLYRQHASNVIGRNTSILGKIKILYDSYLIEPRSWRFVKEFHNLYSPYFPCLNMNSINFFLDAHKRYSHFLLKELFLGNATLHGNRMTFVVKLLIKACLNRVYEKR